jgi:hypothetical protein
MLLNFTQRYNVVLELEIIEVTWTWGLKNRDFHIWNISKFKCERDNEWHQTNIKQCITLKKDNLKNKITPINKRYKIFSRVWQCVWALTNFVFLYPCKFARQLKVILFPLNKIFELIPWNDCNFNVVIKAMLGWDMRKPLDIVLLKWSRRKKLQYLLQSLN